MCVVAVLTLLYNIIAMAACLINSLSLYTVMGSTGYSVSLAAVWVFVGVSSSATRSHHHLLSNRKYSIWHRDLIL